VKRVLIAGEGANELGGWCGEPAFREPGVPGVIEALMRSLVASGWTIENAVQWRKLPNLRTGRGIGPAETRNVRALALFAWEADCDVVVFVRDRDRDEARERAIFEGLRHAQQDWSDRIDIAGGLAVECLEAWLLAVEGTPRTEELSTGRAADGLHGRSTTRDLVELIERRGLADLAEDAASLRTWCDQVRRALNPGVTFAAT
jgi:hypothetical protein